MYRMMNLFHLLPAGDYSFAEIISRGRNRWDMCVHRGGDERVADANGVGGNGLEGTVYRKGERHESCVSTSLLDIFTKPVNMFTRIVGWWSLLLFSPDTAILCT